MAHSSLEFDKTVDGRSERASALEDLCGTGFILYYDRLSGSGFVFTVSSTPLATARRPGPRCLVMNGDQAMAMEI